jgi:multimeric flavodoxin WrbA
MKVYAINGSPRKAGNTATLLQKALDGVRAAAKDQTVETEMINLYDLRYTGCTSCFACKRLGGKSYGKCAVKDDLYEVLRKVAQADGLIFGSPIYFGNITGQLLSFLERLQFPFLVYDKNRSNLAPKRMPTAFIYTMNVPEEIMSQAGYLKTFDQLASRLGHMLTRPAYMCANDTYQFDDYSKYASDAFSEEAKAAHRETQFPIDCQKAYDLGVNLLS